ncbi:unnamed protein product [Rotaria sp. Silwood2]|nr:unnamed protein product [Rotaria sp. Silwood2]
MKGFILVILLIIRSSNGRCPKATFQFKNQTKWASYNFIDSSIGNIGSLETCPYTGRPYVYLPCYPNSSWGHEPYFSTCSNPINVTEQTKIILFDDNSYQNQTIEEIAKLPMNTSYEISNVLSYLNDETTSFKSSFDITSVVNILVRIITNNQNTDDIQSNLYSIANKLLSLKSTSHMQQAQKMNRSIVKLLSLLEIYSQNLTFDELEKSFIKTNLAVSIVNRPNSWTKPIIGFEFDPIKNKTQAISFETNHQNSTIIILDPKTIIQQNRLTFSVYNQKNGLFNDKQYRLLTRVISLTIDKPELIKTMRSFVRIHFFMENNFNEKNLSLICAYWNIFDNMTALWSRQGCNLSNVTERSVTCICNHLTHFAVLTDIEQKPIPKYIEQILSIITLTGLVLSSIGLCLTILTFILFNWMFIMALIQYLLFVKVFPNSISAFTRKAAAFSQLVPLIPVIIILVFDPLNYTNRNDQICWLSNYPFYLSFVLPIVFYILINSILYSIVAYSLLCNKKRHNMRSTQTIESQRLSRFSIALCCFIVLGLTWIFGLFTIGPIRILFQIFFCIFASLTGFFIFLLYIITSKTKRTYWNNTFKTLGISSIYSPTSSSSSGFLGSKEFSTPSVSDQLKASSHHMQYTSKPQHFIDAYMPSSPPPPAPPILPPPPPPLLMEGDDSLCTTNMTNLCYEPRHVWAPETNYIYETNQLTTSLDDYSLFYASNYDATKL